MGHAEQARKNVAGPRHLQAKGSRLRCASTAMPHDMAGAPSVAASAWLVLATETMSGNALAQQVWRLKGNRCAVRGDLPAFHRSSEPPFPARTLIRGLCGLTNSPPL